MHYNLITIIWQIVVVVEAIPLFPFTENNLRQNSKMDQENYTSASFIHS